MRAVARPPATWRPVFAMALPWAMRSSRRALTPQVFTGMLAIDWPQACMPHSSAAVTTDMCSSAPENMKRATVMSARPATEMARGPKRSNTMPATGLRMMPTAAAGSMTMPVSKALAPRAVWSRMGSVVLVTRQAALMSVTTSAAVRKLGVLSVASSSKGFSMRRLRRTKHTRHTMPATMLTRTIGLVQPRDDALEKP